MTVHNFKYNEEVVYNTGGIYLKKPIDIIKQSVIISSDKKSFNADFPNIFENYLLPKISSNEIVNRWNADWLSFWQNQLNFAIWCATTGCGIDVNNHLKAGGLTGSLFLFHVYYQTRRILFELSIALPQDKSWNAFNNSYDRGAYERICKEFNVDPHSDWRQKMYKSGNGLGLVHTTSHSAWKRTDFRHDYSSKHISSSTSSDLDLSKMTFGPEVPGGRKCGISSCEYLPPKKVHIDYILQEDDVKDVWTTFILDTSEGFTRAGVQRINESIRTYCWAILGSQSQTRTDILGTGTAFDAQKQFLANVEDAINSPVDLPSQIKRYQNTLKYARSKVDYVFGIGLYMAPSDMELRIGEIQNYNNKIIVATDYQKLGLNNDVNIQPIPTIIHTEIKGTPTKKSLQEPKEIDKSLVKVSDGIEKKEKNISIEHEDKKTALIVGSIVIGFLDFLSAMVGKEAEDLPRGIYFTSLRQQGSLSNQSKELTAIPNFVQSQYDKNKQPGLRASLAVALLFTYDPKIEVGRDGRPRKHYMLSHGKNYQQVFNTLLQDVPVQPSDWYRTSLMGQAWTAFVDRLFSAMLQARKAEIDLQLNRDFIDEKEAEEKKLSAWFWVRDSIVDMIKKSTRGNPSVQFNAVLALSGLARSVHRYISSLDSEERKRMDDVTEHTSHSHWLVIMIDSCMSLIDFTYMPKSTLFGLCQQRSVDDRLPASILAQAAGVLALCQIASLIMNNYIELVYQLLDMLIQWLPGKQSDDDCPPVLHFFRSLGLGVFLDQLISSNFTEIAGSKGSLALWKALDKLEECCLSDSEHRTGALLGLSVSLGTLCQDGKTESRVHISAIHAKLKDALKQAPREHSNFQVLCTCIGLVTGTGFVSNILDKSCFDETVAIIQDLTDTNTQGAGICLALGSLSFAGEIGGHPEISQLKQKLISDWTTTLTKADGIELERVASLYGLMSVMGYNGLYANDDTKSLSTSRAGIDTVLKSIKDLVTSCDLVGIQATAGWLLGTIYMSASSTNYSSSVSAPGTYSYLQENSILRAVVDFLIQAGKQGPEFIPSKQVEACLVSLQREVTATLPPLNWMGILSPLMKLQFDEEIKLQCIKLAIKLSSSSSSAALVLAAWIVPPLFNTLTVKFQCLLLSSAGHYVKTVTPDVLKSFLDKCCRPVFSTLSAETGSKEGRALKIAVLKGLHSSIAVHDPPESVTAMLYEMVEFVYQHTGSESDVDVLINLAECLRNIPDSLLDKITTGDCTGKDSVTRGTFIRSFLVANGNQPITLLNSCIDAAFNIECDRDKVLSILVHSFQRMMMLEGTKKPTLQCVQWLHEITGHCRNIAMGTFKLTAEDADISKATQFAVNIIAAAVCLWTSRSSVASLLNINFDLLTVPTSGCEEGSDWLEKCFEHDDRRIDWSTGIKPLNCMQAFIQNLTSEPWNQVLQKIVDWHVAMFETAGDIVSKDMKKKLMECLFCLRHCAEFKKLTTWTKAVMFTV